MTSEFPLHGVSDQQQATHDALALLTHIQRVASDNDVSAHRMRLALSSLLRDFGTCEDIANAGLIICQ